MKGILKKTGYQNYSLEQLRDTSGRRNATMKLTAQTFIWGNVMVGRLTEAQKMTVQSTLYKCYTYKC